MFGFARRNARQELIGRLHRAAVERSRLPALYGPGLLPDTVEGRFESLTLHVLLLMRRLRALPPPASEVAQELIDAVFAHLEIALRESGIGDFGVPKRMKKLARAFYDRVSTYEAALATGDAEALAGELGRRLDLPPSAVAAVAGYVHRQERSLAGRDLDAILAGDGFSDRPEPAAREEAL